MSGFGLGLGSGWELFPLLLCVGDTVRSDELEGAEVTDERKPTQQSDKNIMGATIVDV